MKRIIALTVVAVALAEARSPAARGGRTGPARRARAGMPQPSTPARCTRTTAAISWQLPELRHAARGGSYGSVNGRRRAAHALPHGAVQVSHERQQAIGIRSASSAGWPPPGCGRLGA